MSWYSWLNFNHFRHIWILCGLPRFGHFVTRFVKETNCSWQCDSERPYMSLLDTELYSEWVSSSVKHTSWIPPRTTTLLFYGIYFCLPRTVNLFLHWLFTVITNFLRELTKFPGPCNIFQKRTVFFDNW